MAVRTALIAVLLLAAAPAARAFELVMETESDIDSLDPAITYYTQTWQYEEAMCARLVAYAQVPGPTSFVPDVAAALPTLSPDGTVYTFTLRSGDQAARFSNGAPVTADDVLATFARARTPELSPYAPFFMDDVKSIEAAGSDVRITLQAPAGDFLHRLTMQFFCILPAGTPLEPLQTPPITAGPYQMVSYTPVTHVPGELVLHRNPYYRGPREARPDVIRYRLGIPWPETVAHIDAGLADYAPFATPLPGADPDQLVIDSGPNVFYLAMRTTRSLFSDENARRAVGYAIDRGRLARERSLHADDDLIPPGMEPRQPSSLFPLDRADPQTARALLGNRSGPVVLVIRDIPEAHSTARTIRENLAAAGLEVAIHPVRGNLFKFIEGPGQRFDMVLGGWFADYPDPYDFLNLLIDFDFAHTNYAEPSLIDGLRRAAALSGEARMTEYRRLSGQARAAAPLVVIGNFVNASYFSKRIGCRVLHPIYGYDLSLLCLR